MPLISATIIATLTPACIPSQTHIPFAQAMATGVSNYFQAGMTARGGALICAGTPLLISQLIAAFSTPVQSGAVTATQVGNAIGSFVQTITSAGPGGSGVVTVNIYATLIAELVALFSTKNEAPVFVQRFAQAVDNYARTVMIMETGVLPAIPPMLVPII